MLANNNFKLPVLGLVWVVATCGVVRSEVPRPRGVSLSRAILYVPTQDFACFDGRKTIPFSQVNDDYCDCLDASDEPGTAACPHGTFHCTNAGHKPANIASSRVNDGVCDCCDGTDEYSNKKSNCQDTCLQLGRHAREEAQRVAELIKAGKQMRAELSQRGIHLKQEKKDKLGELQKNREEADKVKAEKQALKDQIESLENTALEHYRKLEEEERRAREEAEAAKNKEEAVETFNKFDSNLDGVVDIAELQTRKTFDKDNNGEVSDEEARYFLNNEDAVDVEKFVESAWANIKPFLMREAGLFKPPSTEGSTEAADMGADDHHEEEHEEEAHEEGEDTEDDDDDEGEDEPEPYQTPEEVAKAVQSSKYDEETQKLVEQATAARNDFAEAERAVRSIETEIKDIEEYLKKDFGPEEEFASLEGQCFDYEDHEYVYKLCPFEKVSQQPKSGSSETRLGTWGRWSGTEDDIYQQMTYDKGQSCWNGPQRSTVVRLSCGMDNRVTAVSEPNRCEYMFDFTSPAICRESSETDDDIHDEL